MCEMYTMAQILSSKFMALKEAQIIQTRKARVITPTEPQITTKESRINITTL
jgi:hypothetical protein